MALTKRVQTQQYLRLQRHAMATGIYFLVLFAIYLIQKFEFGTISQTIWILLFTLGVAGNLIFFSLIYSGVNLRFSDPSLTCLQIGYAGTLVSLILYALPNMRPVILLFFIPAFSFGMLRLNRWAYFSLVLWIMGLYGALLFFEFFGQRPLFDIKYELFLFVTFSMILAWFAFFGGFISNIRRRLRKQKKTIQMANEEILLETKERRRIQIEKDQLKVELQKALSEVKALSGLLPVCGSCKKIRDDSGYWNQLEDYIGEHARMSFTHGICPECAKAALLDVNRYFSVD